MKKTVRNIKIFNQVAGNLYKLNRTNAYFRLFADGKTPNGCWLINPRMIRLIDIDVATGKDVLGDMVVPLDYGTVNASRIYA